MVKGKNKMWKAGTAFISALILLQVILGSGIYLENSKSYAASTGVRVEFFNGNTDPASGGIAPRFKVLNNSSTGINLGDIKLRYYYTIDGERQQNFFCDWSTVGNTNVTGAFVKMSNPTVNADYYLEVGFLKEAGTLAAGGSVDLQARFSKGDWSSYTQTNDYSFNSTAVNFTYWDKITCYNNGILVQGVPPIVESPTPTITNSPTPKPTSTPTSTMTSTPKPTATPTATPTSTMTSTPISGAPSNSPTATPAGSLTSPLTLMVTPSSKPEVNTVSLGKPALIEYSQSGDVEVKSASPKKEILMLLDSSCGSGSGFSIQTSPFKYSLFSRTNTTFVGMNINVTGDMFTRDKFTTAAAGVNVSGLCEYGQYEEVSYPIIPNKKQLTPDEQARFDAFDKFEFFNVIQSRAAAFDMTSPTKSVFTPLFAQNYFSPSKTYYLDDGSDNGQTVYVKYVPKIEPETRDTFEILGSDIFKIKSDMFFDGNVKIALRYSEFAAGVDSAFILATGNITISGEVFSGNLKNLYLYSLNGDIQFDCSSTDVGGMAFAPRGRVIFKGSNIKYAGSAVGNGISQESSDVTFTAPNSTLIGNVIDDYIVDVYSFEMIKEKSKNFAALFDGEEAKIGVLQYNRDANTNNFKLYDMKTEATALNNYISSMAINSLTHSNLGDAMRRAYHLFNDPLKSSADANKYIVVLSGNVPNTCTYSSTWYNWLKLNNGDAEYTKKVSGIPYESYQASQYVEEFGDRIKAEGTVKTVFMDLGDILGATGNLRTLSQKAGVTDISKDYYYPADADALTNAFNSAATKMNGVAMIPLVSNLLLNSAVFELLLPEGVIPRELIMGQGASQAIVKFDAKNLTTTGGSWSISNTGNRYKLSGNLNGIQITKMDSNTYRLNSGLFKLKVTFTAKRSEYVNYKLNKTVSMPDAKVTYRFNSLSGSYPVSFNAVSITLVDYIDIT